jgi:hypothetical protein
MSEKSVVAIFVDDDDCTLTIRYGDTGRVTVPYTRLSVHLPSQRQGTYNTVIFEAPDKEFV